MNNRRQIILIILFPACANVGSALAQAGPEYTSVESATWRFEIDNDLLFHKDNQISRAKNGTGAKLQLYAKTKNLAQRQPRRLGRRCQRGWSCGIRQSVYPGQRRPGMSLGGYNMPRGFASTPDPIGLSMHYVAALQPENPQAGSLYATLSACGLSTILIHSVFLFNSVKTVGALYLVWLGILSCMIFRIKRYLTTGPTRRILNTISGSVLIAFGIKLGIQRS